MFTYFFVTFEVHYIVFRYNVYLNEYMDLSPRLTPIVLFISFWAFAVLGRYLGLQLF